MQRTTRFGLVLCLAIAAPARPDALPEARTEIVRLDAVVTDSHGVLVTNLEQKDFQVLEDGKPQAITDFAFGGRHSGHTAATSAPAPAEAPSGSPAAATPSEEEAPAALGRNVLIIVDDLHIAVSGLDQTKKALRRVLEELVAANDEVGLVSTSPRGPVQNFTRDRQPLKAAIDSLSVQQRTVPLGAHSQMTPAQAELILSGDRTATQLAGRMMLAEPGSRLDNAGPQAALQGRAANSSANRDLSEGKQELAEIEAKRQARAILDEALASSIASLQGTENAIRSLSQMPGRKICLLVSDGFLVGAGTPQERTVEMQRIVDAATRSGAVLYALDSQGLATASPDASTGGFQIPPGLQSGVDRRSVQLLRTTLQTMSAQTGGFVVSGTNDFAAGLNRILQDNEAYYLLAYQSSNPKRDGRFRKLEVRIAAHSDYVVRTRKGYLAPDDKHPAKPAVAGPAGPAPLLESEARAALDHLPANGVPVRLNADYVDLPPGGPQAIVRVQMPLSTISWEKADGRRRASVEWIIGVYDAAGAPVGVPFSRRSDLDLSSADYDRAMSDGLRYQHMLPLHPGRYQIRIVARDGKGAPLGGTSDAIEIPDLGEKKLTLSSLFLSAAAGETMSDAQVVRRFKRGSTVFFQLYVYNPTLDEKGASDVVLQAQLRSGGKPVAASKPQPVSFEQKDGAPVPQTNGMSLEGLPPGPYELRVVVFDRKANVSMQRNLDLTLE